MDDVDVFVGAYADPAPRPSDLVAATYDAHQRELYSFALRTSRDPEVRWRLADVLSAQQRFEEAETQLDVARFGFEELLGRHLLAFADHAAEFYAGSGNDCRRALELARSNVANRPTRRAVKQAYALAAIA